MLSTASVLARMEAASFFCLSCCPETSGVEAQTKKDTADSRNSFS